MKTECFVGMRYIFENLEVVEIFNGIDNTWDYYTTGNNTANLEFCIGVHFEDRLCVESLYNDGFFDYLEEV